MNKVFSCADGCDINIYIYIYIHYQDTDYIHLNYDDVPSKLDIYIYTHIKRKIWVRVSG